MSRVGKAPIEVPEKVRIEVLEGRVHVKGPKGEVSTVLPDDIETSVEDGKMLFRRTKDTPRVRALHGLTRALVANAVEGVTAGFQRELEIVGIGYRGAVQGRTATFTLGFSHPAVFAIPEGIEIEVQDNTKVIVRGVDKQKVGQVAADIRALRPPDSYKGKGIRYKGETLRIKVGKSGVGSGA